MAEQSIVWIALPNGYSEDGSQARLSVVVAPRLTPDADGRLAPFDFLSWAGLVQTGLVLDMAFGATIVPSRITSQVEPALWSALFGPDTPVRPYSGERIGDVYATYPAAKLHDLVKQAYQESWAASASEGLSPPKQPTGLFGDLLALFDAVPAQMPSAGADPRAARLAIAEGILATASDQSREQRLAALRDLARQEALAGGSVFTPLVPGSDSPAEVLAAFLSFHDSPTPAEDAVPPADEPLDFHGMLTALGSYYQLLRSLGLVIDVTVDAMAVPAATAEAPGEVSVMAQFSGALPTTMIRPQTAYVAGNGKFTAAARAGAPPGMVMVDGLLDLAKTADGGLEQFRLLQIDVDGTGFKLLNTLGTIAADAAANRTTPELPAIRSSGLSVVSNGAANLLHTALSAGGALAATLMANAPVILFAEDLVRGFRVDIEVGPGNWRSLHARQGVYRFKDGSVRTIQDEGAIEPNVSQPDAKQAGLGAGPDPNATNHVAESLFFWRGWSFAAPRPGEVLEEPVATHDAPQGWGLDVTFSVPDGSLPRLRYGAPYRVRLRAADLAGNGLTVTAANKVITELEVAGKSPVLPQDMPLTFLRFEPAPAPVPVFRNDPQPGDDAGRIVLRSTADLTPDAFAAAHPVYALSAERHIVPPAASAEIVELSALFDGAMGPAGNSEAAFAVLARRAGSLWDGALHPPPAAGAPNVQPVHPEAALTITYLPDPLVRGATLCNLPGLAAGSLAIAGATSVLQMATLSADIAADSVLVVDFAADGEWPERASFRLSLAEGDVPPQWDSAARVLKVFLPKGTESVVSLSAHPSESGPAQHGIAAWIAEQLVAQRTAGVMPSDVKLAAVQQRFSLGIDPTLSPPRQLRLAHAVPQPVSVPVLTDFAVAGRLAGRTFAQIGGTVTVHAGSAGRADVIARWREPDETVDREKLVLSVDLSGGSLSDNGRFSYDGEAGVLMLLPFPVKRLGERVAQAVANLDSSLDAFRAAVAKQPADEFWEAIADRAAQLELTLADLGGYEDWRALAAATSDPGFVAYVSPPQGGPPPPVTAPAEIVNLAGVADQAAASVSATANAAVEELAAFGGVRHEFGDTRHRVVDYRVVITSRFASDFTADAYPGGFSVESAAVTVSVPASAPPLPPVIDYVVPCFLWQRSGLLKTAPRVSERRTGFRIYLQEPWFSSGDGELLGVVTGAGIPPLAEADIERFTSRWSRDSLWAGGTLGPLPQVSDFLNPVQSVRVSLHPDDAGSSIMVAAFAVQKEDGRRFCDILVAPQLAYMPFVRLALVRYQPQSIGSAAVSRVVLADFVQLQPHRTLSVVRSSSDTLSVTVGGVTHANPRTPGDPAGPVGTEIQVRLQTQMPNFSGDLGWVDAAVQPSLLNISTAPADAVLWRGDVVLPLPADSSPWRLLIEEHEWLDTIDPFAPVLTVARISRIIFAEAVAL
jgi:hypothetical protein